MSDESFHPRGASQASDSPGQQPRDPRPLIDRCETQVVKAAVHLEAARRRIRSQLAMIRRLQANGHDTARACAVLRQQRTLLTAQRGHLAAFRRLVATFEAQAGRPRFSALAITLYRSDNRALLLLRGTPLAACPARVRDWLGFPTSAVPAELTLDTPMPGINAMRLRKDLLRQGYCALDMHGVVSTFGGPNSDGPPV